MVQEQQQQQLQQGGTGTLGAYSLQEQQPPGGASTLGRAVQVEPMKLGLNAPGTKRSI